MHMKGFSACGRLALLLAAAAVVAAPVGAQTNQPVYPVYDGFVVNENGTYTSFTPALTDRGQTTTFLPGHHRYQCVMVVEPGVPATLRWRLTHADVSTSTSEDMLQYNWEMDESGTRQVMRAVDPDTAPRGVCLNRPPIVRLLGLRGGPEGAPPEVSVPVGEPLALFGSVNDEGLPRDRPVTVAWRIVESAGDVTFDSPDVARTRATFSAAGAYELELWASDSELENTTRVSVVVK
jgi:hypothetical protein